MITNRHEMGGGGGCLSHNYVTQRFSFISPVVLFFNKRWRWHQPHCSPDSNDCHGRH